MPTLHSRARRCVPDLFAFSTLWRSVIATFQSILGGFAYTDAYAAHHLLAPVLYFVLTLFGTLFIANLMIGYLGSAIGDAQASLQEQREFRSVFDRLARRRRVLCAFRDALEARLSDNDANVLGSLGHELPDISGTALKRKTD